MKKDGLIPIKEFIKDIFKRYYMDGTKNEIMNEWKESLGKDADHAHIVSLKNGQLLVEVDHPIFLQELSFKKMDLKKRLNNRVGRSVVRDITIRGGTYLGGGI